MRQSELNLESPFIFCTCSDKTSSNLRPRLKATGSKLRGSDKKVLCSHVVYSQQSEAATVEKMPGFIELPTKPMEHVHNFDLQVEMMEMYHPAFFHQRPGH
jgi:hypothetical protein